MCQRAVKKLLSLAWRRLLRIPATDAGLDAKQLMLTANNIGSADEDCVQLSNCE